MSESSKQKGDKYEAASRQLLENLKVLLGIESFEPGQGKVPMKGEQSGEEWDADLVAYKVDGKRIKVECRYTAKRSGAVKRADMASIAYEVKDTASDGIVITNWPMQLGAENIAKAEKICVIEFRPGLTVDEYEAEIRNLMEHAIKAVGFGEAIGILDELTVTVEYKNPNSDDKT